ncbi:MAG TPA: riboflavin biosynthesis protein RibF, partial [Planctomycetota bacterium]|nr:riboflavin biosynthesis protein RibF [Planctomycetota bacterium]
MILSTAAALDMKRYLDLDAASRDRSSDIARVATIGFFDGVHRGHVHVIEELRSWARELGAESAVITFDRHPQAVLGGHPPVPIVNLAHRLLLLERAGVDATLVLRFDPDLASWSPEEFVERVLHRALGARALLFGFDSAFGQGRKGTWEYLTARSAELALELRRVDAKEIDGERVSSTLLRSLLADGQLGRVEQLLGRPFSVLGRVVPGDARGRELGFPTANLDIGRATILPRGVYFADVLRLGRAPDGFPRLPPPSENPEVYAAVVNVGCAPTLRGDDSLGEEGARAFDPSRDRVEAHLLDFDGDLYGEHLEVFVTRRHREERRFADVRELIAQIERDVAAR